MIQNTKFYIGPMSKNIVDSIVDFCESENYNIGLIPSRRQIEYNGGYANSWTTEEFIKYVRNKTNKVLLCRDHAGIGQGENIDNGTLSLYNDCNFDIIHIDPWKIYKKLDDALTETVDNIKFVNSINPNCKFEVGTEESITPYSPEELNLFLNKLQDNLGSIYNNVVYGVIQSGTKLIGTKNVGIFNAEKCKNMIDICHKNGLLSKEHNGDYLENEEIKTRFELGLDAINIAPEYGEFETSILLQQMNEEQIEDIYKMCLKSKKWIKWFPSDFEPDKNKLELIHTSCHYIFDNDDFKNIKYQISNIDEQIKNMLFKKLKNIKNIWK